MKKRIISLIFICMVLILTAGCGKNSDKTTSNQPKKTTAVVLQIQV